MKRCLIHHPDISPTILRRTLSAELIDLLGIFSEFVFTRGKSATWNHSFPSGTFYRQAIYRLRKNGLIAYRRTHGRPPVLHLTPEGQSRISDIIFPERFWNQRWDGRWYLLMYDIPETQRPYRSALGRFLARQRLGCLQKSVWISARDIRPLFHDLQEAAAIRDYACLFEAQTVLGQQGAEISAQAWDFDRLNVVQTSYLAECDQGTAQAPGDRGRTTIFAMMHNALAAYVEAMRYDPLLPSALWPPDYCGPKVASAFRHRLRSLAKLWP
ncbi:MAG: hypothetical protein KKG09_05045 [Verrucomicrobia bacterium]|nr:hypothetical protein [Verrucomicrobiota bacterium]MBU4292409.1 hypothetical protein [Verrucomicrobiota bacterium]MBU4429771.1 hypothetical protein [Verrucomicrobiota bacterium]MBU4497352.1 hypothetical protein [Verrucomicrobiota bacterium]MCG2679832.1 hypothetical protein [Kiritimatiellia bacterium]